MHSCFSLQNFRQEGTKSKWPGEIRAKNTALTDVSTDRMTVVNGAAKSATRISIGAQVAELFQTTTKRFAIQAAAQQTKLKNTPL